jgi:TatD DNase family protein
MFDAHNHLQDPRLDPWREAFLRELPRHGVRRAVVNGTRESDWDAVAALARTESWVQPSFGLHPWYVRVRSAHWLEALTSQLDAHPEAGVGEIGLDRWVEGFDFPGQLECFSAQMRLAAERNRPATLHCLKAWGALLEQVRKGPVPERGFLLHAYSGPSEMVSAFVQAGAYFSFSTYFLHERKAAQREVFADIPADRLLVETDAPDMAPPPGEWDLRDAAGKSINHPGNLARAYEGLASVRQMRVEELNHVVAENFARLFGAGG